jgi:hypothetical protein
MISNAEGLSTKSANRQRNGLDFQLYQHHDRPSPNERHGGSPGCASLSWRRILVGLFVITALIFNPFIPIHLTRGVWSILNVAAAALFIGHFIVARPQLAAPETIADR